jgi:hypothetical protein
MGMAMMGEGAKVLRQLFKELEKQGGKKMYRESFPKPIRQFDEVEQMMFDEEGAIAAHGEPGGIYRANHPYDIPSLVSGWKTPRKEVEEKYRKMNDPSRDTFVGGTKANPKVYPFDEIALPLPGSRQKTFSLDEWRQYHKMPYKKLTKTLKKDYDFVDFPDVAAGNPELRQTVQLNPNKAVVRFGKTDYGIVGAGGVGALGLLAGDALSPNDADAAGLGLGKQIKGVFKLFKTAMRSKTSLGEEMARAGQKEPGKSKAHDALVGLPFKGSKVSGVYQGVGERRYIHLEDGRIFPANTSTIHDLAAARGTTKSVSKFDSLPTEEARWEHILKSLAMNEARGVPPRAGGAKPLRIAIIENSLSFRNETLSPEEVADQLLVQSTRNNVWFLWPKKFAEPAEAAGLVRIDRAKHTLSTNKGLFNGKSK